MVVRFIFSFLLALLAFSASAQDNWQCYKTCMASGGKLPAECNNKCQMVRMPPAENTQYTPSPPQQMQHAPAATYSVGKSRRPAGNQDAFVNQQCYNTCISHGKMHGDCVSECPKSTSSSGNQQPSHSVEFDHHMHLRTQTGQPPSQEWYRNQGDVRGGIVPRQKPAAPGKNDSFNVHFGCFKMCRDEGGDFKTCRKTCEN